MNIKKISYTGMFAALIFVLTMFVKVPVASGYVHFGDALAYICALVLGSPYALIAAALGEGLADIAGGYVMYFPATVIIKCLIVLPFVLTRKKNNGKYLTSVTAFLTILAGVITVGGYFIADLIIDKSYAVVDIPGNLIQAVGSAIAFMLIALALDKSNINDKINFG